jgi:hypothetical protein
VQSDQSKPFVLVRVIPPDVTDCTKLQSHIESAGLEITFHSPTAPAANPLNVGFVRQFGVAIVGEDTLAKLARIITKHFTATSQVCAHRSVHLYGAHGEVIDVNECDGRH